MTLCKEAVVRKKLLLHSDDKNEKTDMFLNALKHLHEQPPDEGTAEILRSRKEWEPDRPNWVAQKTPFELQYYKEEAEEIPLSTPVRPDIPLWYFCGQKDEGPTRAAFPMKFQDTYCIHAWEALLESAEVFYSEDNQQFEVKANQLGNPFTITYDGSDGRDGSPAQLIYRKRTPFLIWPQNGTRKSQCSGHQSQRMNCSRELKPLGSDIGYNFYRKPIL